MKSLMHRRTFLRGMLAGSAVSVGLPLLDIFLNDSGTAFAVGGGLPKRFGLFFWGNGILPDRWVPTGTGAGDAWTLSEQLAPLASVKDDITLVTGMSVKVPNVEPHTAGAAGILSGAPLLLEGDHRTFTMPSIDQVIAAELGGYTRFRSIEFGAAPKAGLSYNGPDNQNPPESSPKALFDRIFGGGFTLPGEDGVADPSLGLRRSVLDAVMEDAAQLQSRLGAADKARLDQHLTGIRELEKRIAWLEENPPSLEACGIPATPAEIYPDVEGRPQLSTKNRVMMDTLAMALACDQTRVFTNWFTYSVNNLLFPGAPSGHHQLTHDEPGDQPEVNKIVKHIMEELRYTIEALRAVPEGDGTLLDNTILLATTDCSLGRTHSMDDFPIVLAGTAGGTFKKNFHYRSPSKENASKVLLSIVRSLVPVAGSFGAADGRAEDGLGDIEVL